MSLKLGGYTRLSKDRDGTETATKRQREDYEKWAKANGHKVVAHYRDSDFSAYKRNVVRPDFRRLLRDLEAGVIEGVVVWRSDRFTRQPREIEEFLELAERTGARLWSVMEPFDDSAMGLYMLRMFVNNHHFESAVKSERIKRKFLEQAEAGAPAMGGRRPYGYNKDRLTVNQREAKLIHEAADRVLRGESLSAIVTDWQRRKLKTSEGSTWTTGTLRRILTSPTTRGWRTHLGEPVAKGVWPAILSEEVAEELIATLRRPDRKPPAHTYMLSGLLYCGRCGEKLLARRRDDLTRSYGCIRETDHPRNCGKLRVVADPLELLMQHVVLTVLDDAGAFERLAAHDKVNVRPLVEQRQQLQTRLDTLEHAHYVEGELTEARYKSLRGEITAKLEKVQRQLDSVTAEQVVSIARPDAVETWQAGTMSDRKQLVRALFPKVTVQPIGKGKPFTVERIELEDRKGGQWAFSAADDERPTTVWAPGGGYFPLYGYDAEQPGRKRPASTRPA